MSSAPAVAVRVAKSQVSELIFSALPSIDSPARLSQIESMPIVSPHNNNPLADGRQSKCALLVRRGVQRLFFELGAVVLPELTLVSGRRADLIVLGPKGDFTIIEIKSSIEDFRADSK